jgi:uncharacterized protein (DUF885 family)
VRRHTTTRMTPDEIRARPRRGRRIRGGMEEVMRKVGYQGTLAEFFRYVQESRRSTSRTRRTSCGYPGSRSR